LIDFTPLPGEDEPVADALLNWDSNADERFEECIARFEESWEKHLKQGGPRPVWYESLPADEPLRSLLAGELACIDLERRLASGDTDCSVGDYFQQMPGLAMDRAVVRELVQVEVQGRLKRQLSTHTGCTPEAPEPARAGSDLKTTLPLPCGKSWQTPPCYELPTVAAGPEAATGPSPESPRDVPGWEVRGWIGQGGMGDVWRVLDLLFQRLLAIKVMKAGESEERFIAEARITAQLAHPSIVPVQVMGRLADGRPYYTMKLVEGKTLAEKLQAEPDLASQRTKLLQVFARVCEALAFAHEKGVIHLDLKPSNVMVGEHGEVLVMDWGLAKLLDDSDEQLGVGGTWPYMSPEQANGRVADVDRRSDVFGLGGVLCAILTGKPPYVGDTKDEVKRQACAAHLEGAYARLEECGADADLIKLAKRCLAKKPDGRLQDASEVAKAVAAYLADVEERAQKARVAQAVAEEKIARALMAASGGDLEAAEKAIAEAELAGASTGQVRMVRGQIALHRGQSREAMRHLEQAVQLLPKSVAAQGMLAAAYAYDGQWEQYDKTIQKITELSPSTPQDLLFKGCAEAWLDPARGLQTIRQAFDRRPMMGIALLLRAEVRGFVAQDTDDLAEAEGAVQDAVYARELLRDNPAALWVSLYAHRIKAGLHEHRDEPVQRRAELELAGKYADALKPFTALPEAVIYRWLYFREIGKEEEVLDDLRLASEQTDHVYVTFCYALTLYRRGKPGDLKEARRVLEYKHGTYNDRLLPFVLAEHDHGNRPDWPIGARNALKDFAARCKDGAAVMDAHAVLCLLGEKREMVEASNALLKQEARFYTLRRDPIWRCVKYNAGKLPADELLQKAEGSQWDQCLAHYYIAMSKLAAGDREGAKEHFDKAVNTKATGWGPYDMSWVFQARLANDDTWPPWIPKRPAK
jgi:hypothetical protein